MARGKELRVLVATDGSVHARHAVTATAQFPWPDRTRVRAVVARRTRAEYRRSILLSALDRSADFAAKSAQRSLSRRWPNAAVVVADKTPIEGVLGEAARFRADAIVVGWRGHGVMRRLLMGSVSRGVVRGARCAVLVVRRRSAGLRKILIGIDGSANAQRAVAFVARLKPPKGAEVTLFRAAEQMAVPANALVPSAIHATVGSEIKRVNREQVVAASKSLERAAAELRRLGWRVRLVVTAGAPLRDLLATATTTDADLVVVGARGVGGVRHLLLGSVADGVLNRCPVPVLVVR